MFLAMSFFGGFCSQSSAMSFFCGFCPQSSINFATAQILKALPPHVQHFEPSLSYAPVLAVAKSQHCLRDNECDIFQRLFLPFLENQISPPPHNPTDSVAGPFSNSSHSRGDSAQGDSKTRTRGTSLRRSSIASAGQLVCKYII